MSEKEPPKARMKPEILVSLIIAIIALAGTIGAALISNVDKIWPNPSSGSVPSSTVASSPQQTPSPAPLNISGKWRDNFGTITDVIQRGDTVTATASGIACRGPYDSTGTGTITGNILESTYRSSYSTGRCRGTVSSDGMRIISTCHDSVCGPFESSSVKLE